MVLARCFLALERRLIRFGCCALTHSTMAPSNAAQAEAEAASKSAARRYT